LYPETKSEPQRDTDAGEAAAAAAAPHGAPSVMAELEAELAELRGGQKRAMRFYKVDTGKVTVFHRLRL
jgi:hypothetical protein